MEIIKIPRLRLAQLQILAETSLKFCKNIVELSPYREKVNNALDSFKKSMLKDQASAEGKQILDQKRDKLISGFVITYKAEEFYPQNNEAVQTVLNNMSEIMAKYGSKIRRLSYNEQTVAIDNMLADINKLDINGVEPLALTRWIPLIKAANDEFRIAAETYIVDSTEVSLTDSATASAPELLDALEGMYTMLFALLKLNPTEELVKVNDELETLVNSMR